MAPNPNYLCWQRREFIARLRLDAGDRLAIRWAPDDVDSGAVAALQLCFERSPVPPAANVLQAAAAGRFADQFLSVRRTERGRLVSVACDVPGILGWFLSRAEEYDCPNPDEYGRFPREASLLVREGLAAYPVVDLMIDEIAAAVVREADQMGIAARRTSPWPEGKRCAVCLTHDVDAGIDSPLRYAATMGATGVYHLLRGHVAVSRQRFKEFRHTVRAGVSWQFERFEQLLRLEKAHGFRSTFFAFGLDRAVVREHRRRQRRYEYTNAYMRDLFDRIAEAGHEIGLHSSYEAATVVGAVAQEAARLREAVRVPVRSHRHHFLRVRIPDTLRDYEASGLIHDASLGWSYDTGPRAGTLWPFQMYDLTAGRELNLYQCGTHLMDTAIMRVGGEAVHLDRFDRLLDSARQVQGVAVLLYHPSYLTHDGPRGVLAAYEEILRRLACCSDVWVAPLGEMMDRCVSWRAALTSRRGMTGRS
jgi:peptidoglycan/xylan/chitin deacetylase (PgdA/CDA1 family)